MRRALLVATLFAMVASGATAAAPQEVTLRTDDGVVIAGALYLPGRPGPGIILVHALSRTREDWNTVASRLADAGFVVLAIDLRGHGASGPLAAGATLDDLTPMVADVRAARAFLTTRREAIPGRVGIAGASIGANLAILAAAADSTVRSLALLSPGTDYRGLRPEAAIKKYGDRPALIIASQEDTYATGSARQLAVAGAGPGIGIRELRILRGAGHGAAMLAREPDLASSLVDWFRRTLL